MAALLHLGNALKDYVPVHMIRVQSASEWKKSVSAAYNSDGQMSSADAKTKFLEIVFEWPTFGSTFFEVKQTTNPNYPEVVIIAINKNGINIIHPHTKVSLLT